MDSEYCFFWINGCVKDNGCAIEVTIPKKDKAIYRKVSDGTAIDESGRRIKGNAYITGRSIPVAPSLGVKLTINSRFAVKQDEVRSISLPVES